jgi:hypothetical protein
MTTPNRPKMHSSLHRTYDMLKCAFGKQIDKEAIHDLIGVLLMKLEEDQVADILHFFVEESTSTHLYLQAKNFTAAKISAAHNNSDLLKQLSKCGYEQWKSQPRRTEYFVPSYSMTAYEQIKCAYPDEITENDYWELLAVLYEHFSFRGLATVMSGVVEKDYHFVLSDIYGAHEANIPFYRIESIRKRLSDCGFDFEDLS